MKTIFVGVHGMQKNFTFYLFCKSYLGDLHRVAKLWESICAHNKDAIPFYLCVPSKDLSEFKKIVRDDEGFINWLTDEEVVESNPRVNLDNYLSWDGRLSQQVIKSEFWRIFPEGECDAYLCLDSESQFIKDFYLNDFYHPSGIPYTVMHQNKELLQMSFNKGIHKVVVNFHKECSFMKEVFKRDGLDYDWGPTPVIWSSKVWRDLDEKYLQKLNKTLWDVIVERPSELRWYGEALLEFKSIPVFPREPLFRVYHYDWQYFTLKKQGESIEKLSSEYLGILKQSNWEYELNHASTFSNKNIFSRLLRSLKRFLARFR